MDFSTMSDKVWWLFAFVAAYWAYCLYWGVKGAIQSKTATDYFIAGRGLGLWVFVLAATATSFSGWTFMGHPSLIYQSGFQYAYASFYAITIPFTGILFLKRQWLLGKRYGFVTPGEMLSDYFRSGAIRWLVVLVALIFSIPYLGLQLQASGFLFNILTDGWLDVNIGMYLLSAVVAIYVATGGLRAVAYVDTMQCILLAAGIIAIGIITLNAIGGFDRLNEGIAALAKIDKVKTVEGYSHYVAIPGVIQFVSAGKDAVGGSWTGMMILTYMFALMGIQSAPAFSMWAFSNKSPAPFAPQQVWASSFAIGAILMFFTAIQGIGSHFIGLDASMLSNHKNLVNDVTSSVLSDRGVSDIMELKGQTKNLVPILINLVGDSMPWLVGLLSVCALAAMQSTGAAYMSTAGAMLTRDILKPYLMPNASDRQQKFWGRLGVLFIVGMALLVATVSNDALVMLGGLAVAFGFQMWPALIAICYVPWFTRAGITLGLIAGIIGVLLTDRTGATVASLLQMEQLPWGRNPWTMHSAFWGILANLTVAILVSAVTQNKDQMEHKQKYHNFLHDHAAVPSHKRSLVPLAWILTLTWFFFGIGPGAVIGNTIFGNPQEASTWVFGIPSIWAWQLLWWAIGVFMMWFLAYKMEMSTVPEHEVEVLVEDYGTIN